MGMLPASGETTCPRVNLLPRYGVDIQPPGWNVIGDTLRNVKIKVINSARKNILDENVETYTATQSPINTSGRLDTSLAGLIDLKAKTFSDSNTRVINAYLMNYGNTSFNPYAIGERGLWKLLSEYSYFSPRNYAGTTSRDAGLFNAPSLYASSADYTVPSCANSPYNFLAPLFADHNWHAMRTVTKWSPFGKEVENRDAAGNYSSAVYGYNETLPIAVASNARQGEVLSLGFEDYYLLKDTSRRMQFKYFDFPYLYMPNSVLPFPSPFYTMTMPQSPPIVTTFAHTGMYSYYTNFVTKHAAIPIPVHNESDYAPTVMYYNSYFTGSYHFGTRNEYLSFGVFPGKYYVVNYWMQPDNSTGFTLVGAGVNVASGTSTLISYPVKSKTGNIDGWQQMEANFFVPDTVTGVILALPQHAYIDDLRIFPATSNVKTFVYGPVNSNLHATNEKLMATLDENNFATMYEYDQEGNLVRTKKETGRGIMTASESRKGNPKK
jgi:YD repeat-containing protein